MRKLTLVRVAGVVAGVACILVVVVLVIRVPGEQRSTGTETALAAASSPLLPTPALIVPTTAPQPEETESNQNSMHGIEAGPAFVLPTPEPVFPPTPFPEATAFRDTSGMVTLTFPKGWYYSSSGNLREGETVVTNYDGWNQENMPANLISVHMGVTELQPGQTLEQLIAERIQDARFPKYGSGADLTVEPQPIQLAGYNGLTYTFSEQNKLVPGGVRVVQEIFLLVGDRYVFGTVIDPTTSPEYKTALAILESLKVAGNLGQ